MGQEITQTFENNGDNGNAINGLCGASLLHELPDDVLSLVSKALQPKDLCNMSLSCKKLNVMVNSDKVWWQQCLQVAEIGPDNLQAWRVFVSSYKVICRFLIGVKHLIGIWVHQNPELGNMVYVMWGFLSVIGCRIIPQELGSQGFESGLLWAPVFEVICNSDGSLVFFLHGREKDKDYCYPGSLKPAKDDCNVLLLEVKPFQRSVLKRNLPTIQNRKLSFPENIASPSGEPYVNGTTSRLGSRNLMRQRIMETNSMQLRSKDCDSIQFSRLGFGDRRRLLELVAHRVRLKVPPSVGGPLIPGAGNCCSLDKEDASKDLLLLSERRSLMILMHEHGDPNGKKPFSGSQYEGIQSEIALKILCNVSESQGLQAAKDSQGFDSIKGKSILQGPSSSSTKWTVAGCEPTKKQSFAKFIKERMKQIIGVGAGVHDGDKGNSSCSGENKRVQLQEFLKIGDTVGLCLHASCLKLSMYRAWPIMHDNRFALYKMPEQKPTKGREYAGLWGGTFGWPPGRPPDDKPGKALFFLLLSYEKTDEGWILIATKILEGTHYVLHPNGSAMFTARVDELSSERFPWESDRDDTPVEIVCVYKGEG